MKIARLFVGLGNTGIKYNKPSELGTDKDRGAVLESGAVVRGLGTHFASVADKERYDVLVKQSNVVRVAFAERFVRAFMFDSTFVIKELGEARAFAEEVRRTKNIDPAVSIEVLELELSEVGEGISDRQVAEWSEMVKDQLKRVQLGRKKGEINSEAYTALELLADCPAMAPETAGTLRKLVGEARLGRVKKDEFQRSVAMIEVKMNKDALSSGPKRALPEV